jgi:hypothetical protein
LPTTDDPELMTGTDTEIRPPEPEVVGAIATNADDADTFPLSITDVAMKVPTSGQKDLVLQGDLAIVPENKMLQPDSNESEVELAFSCERKPLFASQPTKPKVEPSEEEDPQSDEHLSPVKPILVPKVNKISNLVT